MINEAYMDLFENYADILDKYTEIRNSMIEEEQDYYNYQESDYED